MLEKTGKCVGTWTKAFLLEVTCVFIIFFLQRNCIHFFIAALQQISKNLVVEDNTNLLAYGVIGQNSNTDLIRLMSKCLQGCIPYGENLYHSLFWFLEATCIPWRVAFFSTIKASNTESPWSHLSVDFILLPPSSAPEDPYGYTRSTCVIRVFTPGCWLASCLWSSFFLGKVTFPGSGH